MPLNETLPADIDRRLDGLGEAIAAAAPDVEFAYLFGSAALGHLRPRTHVRNLMGYVRYDSPAALTAMNEVSGVRMPFRWTVSQTSM